MKKIGADESGKGDYFGYLVVAGVVVDEKSETKLVAAGVKDSKLIRDNSIHNIALRVRKICAHEIVKISPEKYNKLYRKFKNLNILLAWGHARVIENLLEKEEVDEVIVDRFANENTLKGMLFEKGKKAKVTQVVRGESDIAVAAASVLARSEFLKTLKRLSMEVGFSLPKGSAHVSDAVNELLRKYDRNVLDLVAKKHFKITKKLVK